MAMSKTYDWASYDGPSDIYSSIWIYNIPHKNRNLPNMEQKNWQQSFEFVCDNKY